MDFEQFSELAGHSDRVLVDGYEYDHMRFTVEGIIFEDTGDEKNALKFDRLNFEQARPFGDEIEVDDDNGFIRRIKCLKIKAPEPSTDDRFSNGIIELDDFDPSEQLYGKKTEKA